MVAGVELTYDINATAMEMAEAIMGAGVTVDDATYTGDTRASAIYSDGDAISGTVVPGDTGVILSSGQATAFTTTNASESNVADGTTTANAGPNGVDDFDDLAQASTFDASILEIEFTPDPGVTTLSIKFVLASEEYPEFSNSVFNDIIGVWSNDVLVPISVGDGLARVGNINQLDSANLFVDNTTDAHNTEMDGFTLTLSLDIPVNPGETNVLRIGLADVADSQYDSNLLIAADSVQGNVVATDDEETITIGGTKTFGVLDNDINGTTGTLTITHINGIEVFANSSVTLSTGQIVTLNEDGTFTVETDSDVEEINFTYTVESDVGGDDIGIVTIDTVPCFVSGTHVLTPHGERPVEQLREGDLVTTLDHGARPVIWVGSRHVTGRGVAAPIRIAKGRLGNYRTLYVSPQHRILVSDPRAEIMFGSVDVLIAAKHLVDGDAIRPAAQDDVHYVHLLFERHQVICAEGILTESLLPGDMALAGYERHHQMAVHARLAPMGGVTRYGPAARRVLRAHEVDALYGDRAAAV